LKDNITMLGAFHALRYTFEPEISLSIGSQGIFTLSRNCKRTNQRSK
jgi:hypothetical protein